MRAKSAITRKNGNIQQQIQHQNHKSKILQEDRKNFWRQAQQIKEKNKEQIEKLKSQNKRLKDIRDQFISNKKSKPSLSKTAQNLSFASTQSLSVNIKDQNYLRRLLDKERHLTKTKKSALFALQDKLKQVEQNKLGYIQQSPLMKSIRILENRLDKVMIKYNQAQSIQKTYQQVVKRLKEQRVGYDSQLAAIETSLKGRQHDFQELLLLAHDATHAKQAAHAQLKRYQQRRITVQQMRTKYLKNKKQQISKDVPQNNETSYKPQPKPPQNKSSMNYPNSYKHDQNYQRQQLQDFQQAFRKLKEVTGVIDANQIIQKFKTQGLTTKSLQQLRESYRKRIQTLRNQKQNLKSQLQDQKFIKSSGKNERRRLDQIQGDLAKITNLLQRTSIKGDRLSNMMINIKAGIEHLKQLCIFYKRQGENDINNEIEQELKVLNQKLMRMYDVVKNDPKYMLRNYQASAKNIQGIINNNGEKEYVPFKRVDDDQDSQQLQDNFILGKTK